MKKALCVGINDYPGTYNDLSGCVNDANDWSKLLTENFGFDTQLLINSKATHDNFLNGLKDLLAESEEGDVVVLTYSGHGTQVADTSGDEEDGYDEALYLYDGVLLDDELREVLDTEKGGATVYVMLDSCFSGTGTRINGFGRPKFVTTDTVVGFPREKFLQHEMVELLLSGCDDNEYSYDAYINNRYNGAMTYYAIKAIKETNGTWEEAYAKLREYLPSTQYPQSPQLEGTDEMKALKVFEPKEVIVEEPPVDPPVDEPPVEEPPVEDDTPLVVIYLTMGVSGMLFLIWLLSLLDDFTDGMN